MSFPLPASRVERELEAGSWKLNFMIRSAIAAACVSAWVITAGVRAAQEPAVAPEVQVQLGDLLVADGRYAAASLRQRVLLEQPKRC